MDFEFGVFVWNAEREQSNIQKHGIDFTTAALAFADPDRRIVHDADHSGPEPRFFCIGRVGQDVITVRFVERRGRIRIYGAGKWRKGQRFYEKKKA